MSLLPDDQIDLMLLKNICTGRGLEINIAYLAREVGKHRRTVRNRINMLLSHGIIDRPIFPFKAVFNEYPLLVLSYSDLPFDDKTIDWLKKDENIFAAYRIREGESNTVIFEFHKDVWDYHLWREGIAFDGKIPERGKRSPSHNSYFSNRSIFKYEPSIGIRLIEKELAEKGKVEINNYTLDKDAVNILKCLVNGQGIRINENLLAKELGVSRKTILNKIAKFQQKGMILNALCRFKHFFVPPNFLLILSMMEVKEAKKKILQDISQDPHISLGYHISEGRYNLLLFECHKSIEDYLIWEDTYNDKYPGCLGSIKMNILSPKMTILIDQQKVSLGLINAKLKSKD